MTATAPSRILDGQGDELGPITTFGGQVFVVAALILGFQVLGLGLVPLLSSVALLLGLFGALILAPRLVIERIPVSLLALTLLGLMACSVLWTDSPQNTMFVLMRDLPLAFGMPLAAGVLSMRRLVPALLLAIRLSVIITGGAIALLPEARIHIDETGASPDLPGWHGLFPHKNTMAPYLIFGLITILTFDRSRWAKWGFVVAIFVILVGSQSVTGLSGVMLALSVWVWLQLYQNLDLRGSSVFLVTSVSVAVFTVLAVLASLATVASASGKDVTLTGRTYIWAAALDFWSQRPWLGWGIGGMFSTDPLTPATAAIWRAIGFEVPHAHSGVLDIGVQLGIVGVVVFGLLFTTTLIDAVRVIRDRAKLGAWIVSVMVVQIYMSFSEPVFLGSGWLLVLLLFRTLLFRRHGMELETGSTLADRVRYRDWSLDGRGPARRTTPDRGQYHQPRVDRDRSPLRN
ncbi:MAG: O-antigen ligase family protein [Acidimicrobiales bacterium]